MIHDSGARHALLLGDAMRCDLQELRDTTKNDYSRMEEKEQAHCVNGTSASRTISARRVPVLLPFSP